MTFDPFGDFEARGYLRNLAQEKDPAIVRRLEHVSFTTGIDDAFEALKKKKALTYSDVLSTHNTLFEAMYPWAGQDRHPNSAQHCGKPWQRPLRPSKVYSERNRACAKARQ